MAALPPLDTAMSRPSSSLASPPYRMTASRSRTQSISSDRPSTIGHGFMSPPLSVSPEAAFIASSAGSQIVTNDHDSHADAWYDQHGVEPSSETALVSPAALQLVNNFLDQLLFNFLSVSRSTNLSALRPAVSEVLKPKLAKDAINQADEELREYLGGGDDDELVPSHDPIAPNDWDLELVWKRTRLRCMVYSSLGDMEEEDEDYYMEQEHLDPGNEDRLSEVVSPAVAIFLTSILEFMGEQALVVAGQAAYHRMRVKYEKDVKEGARSPADVADRILVEDLDMERVALDRTLGRLWRAWKKKIRSPGIGVGMDHALSRAFSRDSLRGAHFRSPSLSAEAAVPATVPEPASAQASADQAHRAPLAPQSDSLDKPPVDEYELAINLPLPIGPRDVDEIEVPGLACYSDEEAEPDENPDHMPTVVPVRPKSLAIFPYSTAGNLPSPTGSQPYTPTLPHRKRSNSLPTPALTPFSSPSKKSRPKADETAADEQASPGEPSQDQSPETQAQQSKSQEANLWASNEEAPDNTRTGQPDTEATTAVPALVSGSVAAAPGTNPETDHELPEGENDDIEDVEEFVVEEPLILTSSRISISGRSSSPATSDRGKPLSINVNLPARTPSVHSLRLIEVSSPRSPVPRSRGSSVDAAEHSRAGNVSRTSSVRASPLAEEVSRSEALSVPRGSAGLHTGRPNAPATESISEAEEGADVEDGVSPLTPEEAASADPIAALALVDPRGQAQYAPEAIFGSSARHISPPASPARPLPTKVTILSSSTTSGTFFIQDPPEPSDARPVRARPAAASPAPVYNPPPPAVPDRSPSRQGLANVAPSTQPMSIGIVSVDRARVRTSSDVSNSKAQDQTVANGTRPRHTSGASSTSSARLKAMRTSEDSANATPADVARNFEELIHSDQTIQYTLTPESMRDMDTQPSRPSLGGSPLVQVKSRKSEDARQAGDRSRSSSVNKPQGEIKRSTSISRSTGLSSHPIHDGLPNGPRSGASAARGPPAVPSKPRANPPQARDARLPRESVSDLAEFLRSTGPVGASVNPTSGPPVSANAVSRSAGPGALRAASGPVPVANNGEPSRPSPSISSHANRNRLQARDAAVDYKDDNSDLIDFIRRGPPSVAGNPRIPRNVAPFRTTMDSDQMSGAVGGRAVDAQIREIDVRNSQASTNITEASFNSQSALLGRNKPVAGGNGRMGGIDDDDMPIPKRKTRRVRDPYAIDLSDEDELDEGEPTPKASRRAPPQEESLADFLKNYTPPPEPAPAPVPQNRPKKKASAPSLMSRFSRRDNSQSSGVGSNGSTGPKSPAKGVVDSRSLNSRAGGGRGYIPIQVNIPPGADLYGVSGAYGPSNPTGQYGASNGAAPSASGRRVPMKKFEPRDAVSVSSRGTSDLAAFLKNSEPPPNMSAGQLPSPTAEDEAGGISKVFSRRKKSNLA